MYSLARLIGLTSLLAIPIPMLISGGQVRGEALYIFLLLSFMVPFFLQGNHAIQKRLHIQFHKGYFIYSWFFWMPVSIISLYTGSSTISSTTPDLIELIRVSMMNCMTCILFISLTLITMIGLIRWFRWETGTLLKDIANVCLYIVPIPMLLLGGVLYIDLQNPDMQRLYASTMITLTYWSVCILIIFTMITLSLYFFPRTKGIVKGIRFIRIMTTACSWLFINMLAIFSAPTPEQAQLLNHFFPVFKGNLLVFITPGICEIFFISIAISIGAMIEVLLLKMKYRFFSQK